ncbi:MAG: hypothetical protein VR78_06590 [Hoeflea sp. BRH_c9]|nr:MAG: hypothetical protein VR78_06590 [Hoeflea sp. BRH_c9]
MNRPLFKYACRYTPGDGVMTFSYRGRERVFETKSPFNVADATSQCDGRTDFGQACRSAGIGAAESERLIEFLTQYQLVVDGETTLRADGLLSGAELFWRLENLLLTWRTSPPKTVPNLDLDRSIAAGQAPISVVKGLFLEIAHLLRSVPDELACAVESAPQGPVQQAFMEFYEEECNHGRILTDALSSWFDGKKTIVESVPLPTTVARMHAYKGWARKDVLLYATALMRDESSALDAEVHEEEDIYLGMERHYDIPSIVVEKYRWHANLDRQLEHGFFPLEIFGSVDVVSEQRVKQTVSVLQQIVELHELFKWGVTQYYANNSVDTRFDRSASIFGEAGAPVRLKATAS